MPMDMKQFNDEELKQALNLETAQIDWHELQRQFAGGRLIYISSELDLILTAMKFVRDDKQQIEKWVNDGLIRPASDDDARRWHERNANFWSVVVAPWVLVQETSQADD